MTIWKVIFLLYFPSWYALPHNKFTLKNIYMPIFEQMLNHDYSDTFNMSYRKMWG